MKRSRKGGLHRKRSGGPRGIIVYKTYMFKNKDPVIDELRTMFKDSGESHAKISHASGVSVGTFHNWFKGDTRRPSNASVEATGRALGKKRIWVDKSKRR